MKRICLYLLLFCYSLAVFAAELPKKPKLIVAVVIDQFRYDYLLKFGADYTGGLKQLLEHGAVFDDAHHIHFPTVTASGHSTFLTGATPSISGIVGNDWYDREIRKDVTSVEDDSTRLIGGVPGAIGSSPRRLLVSTLGDEIKMQEGRDDARVIGISIKDRASILPSGHMADAAYWFDNASNHWVTSSFYRETLPGWVKELNDAHPNSRAVGAEWLPLDAKAGDKPYCTMVAGQEGTRFCGTLEATPWGNEMIEEFAERALVAENLGHHSGTDVLTVSFSSNDYVGHAVGPDAPRCATFPGGPIFCLASCLPRSTAEWGSATSSWFSPRITAWLRFPKSTRRVTCRAADCRKGSWREPWNRFYPPGTAKANGSSPAPVPCSTSIGRSCRSTK
jgi:predicted AlkP superfamily pyrophosphatase or phosphodiesterase